MTVLVTRAAPGSDATVARLHERGIRAIASPVLVVKELYAAEPDWRGVQALLVTSAAGAQSASRYNGAKTLPALAVGAGTAAMLSQNGFADVQSADGDADALLQLALKRLKPQGGKVVHVRGAIAAMDLAAGLSAQGFDADAWVVYDAAPEDLLSDDAIAGLQSGLIDTVLLHSQAGAAAFMNLMGKAGLIPCLQGVAACVLSARVASALDPSAWRDIRIAPAPNEDALLALIA